MAISTTIRSWSSVMHTGNGSWINLSLGSTAGISAATPLTITSANPLGANALGVSGSLTLLPYQELPNSAFKCQVAPISGAAPSGNYLTIRAGDTVTG